jgi:hypothetical protein
VSGPAEWQLMVLSRRVKEVPMKRLLVALLLLMFVVAYLGVPNGDASAVSTFYSDPKAVVTHPRPNVARMYKELHGYPNYGVRDRAADVLYSTESATWVFDSSRANLPAPPTRLVIRLRLVLDDHYERPINEYRALLAVNGVILFRGPLAVLGVRHGLPFGDVFNNWTTVTLPTLHLVPPNISVHISNLTTGPVGQDWIAIDAIIAMLSIE